MNCYEKYYRRSYNAINRLIDIYAGGYKEKNTIESRRELINKIHEMKNVMLTEQQSLRLTIIIALLGLNKEAIENTEKISTYGKSYFELDTTNLPNEAKETLKKFNDSKTINTKFDEWLSIIKNPEVDKTASDYIRRVRNGLLHSNFNIEDDNLSCFLTHIKTKSYYESLIFNSQFEIFVNTYFSNLEGLGLSENLLLFEFPANHITNGSEFIEFLKKINVIKVNYKNSDYEGKISPEILFFNSQNENGKINSDKVLNKIKSMKNIENLKTENLILNEHSIFSTICYIEKKYGNKFYKLTSDEQIGILVTYLQYQSNSKREISNWLVHFFMFVLSLQNSNINTDFFDGDEYAKDSCYPSLMILKSYLVMYRLQQENFDKINYNDIEFDLDKKDYYNFCYNEKDESIKTDFFEVSFNKEKLKGDQCNTEIWNKIICEVIRDALAHGNIRTFINDKNLNSMIELKDIDKKTGNVRAIQMTINKFSKFLNSKAFEPKYCYRKEESKTL